LHSPESPAALSGAHGRPRHIADHPQRDDHRLEAPDGAVDRYGAGLRAGEVIALKVSDVDSRRMILRIEQGKGRYAMLSPVLRTKVVSRPLNAKLLKVASGPTPDRLLCGPSGQSRIT
jgi:integrase